jgi:neutral trehalase
LARSPFLVQDVLFNSILQRADEDLHVLALELGEPAGEIEGWMARVRANFGPRFWDERAGLYFDYDVRAAAPITVNTATTFLPLYAGLPDARQARRLVEEHLENASEYAPNEIVRYQLTTTSCREPAWDGRRYWRGPVWIILNWLVADGLRRYGYDDLAKALVRDSMTLMRYAGFREYYDPCDGSGLGSTDFSWSAALALEFMAHD